MGFSNNLFSFIILGCCAVFFSCQNRKIANANRMIENVSEPLLFEHYSLKPRGYIVVMWEKDGNTIRKIVWEHLSDSLTTARVFTKSDTNYINNALLKIFKDNVIVIRFDSLDLTYDKYQLIYRKYVELSFDIIEERNNIVFFEREYDKKMKILYFKFDVDRIEYLQSNHKAKILDRNFVLSAE